MGAELYHCATHEGVVIDTTRITLLRKSLGDERTREIVDEVAFLLSDRMAMLAAALEQGELGDVRALSARLSAMSEQVGLETFARVARDLSACIDAGDTTAMAAVSARLARLAEESLFCVIHYADQSAL
jgi:hypothetical protein